MRSAQRDGPVPLRRPLRPLGAILRDRNAIAERDLDAALTRQRRTGMRLGEVATANGWSAPEAVAAALAEQRGLGYANAHTRRPGRSLAHKLPLSDALAHRALPWQEDETGMVYATPDPDRALPLLAGGRSGLVVISEPAFQRGLAETYRGPIAERALTRTPSHLSARSLTFARHSLVGIVAAGLLGAFLAPQVILILLAFIVVVAAAATTATRLAALIVSRRDRPVEKAPVDMLILADHLPPAMVSLLVPLFREAAVLPRLLAGLDRLDYPRDRLEVKLLVETGDGETTDALARTQLPRWIEVLTIPPGGPRTKPRALNVALDFCSGDIVGILDAEDRPDPAQLTVVADHFRRTGPEVAAVQCQLTYFNARENWITRCFQIEYSIWFDVLLRGWQRLRLPIPLGGTSVYFRRSALLDLGGWDAYNVTEDADLGIRIARAGLRCDVVGSTTDEEANCRFGPWIRQRSRWLKGYLMTWLCHMRRPRLLWRDLGPAGFLGFQVLLLGGVISYLAMPLFWAALIVGQVSGASLFGAVPVWALATMAVVFGLGQAVMLAAATLALSRRRALGLIWCVPTLTIYWTMGALAAWKAVAELAVAPYFWDKTRHGITRMAPGAARKSATR